MNHIRKNPRPSKNVLTAIALTCTLGLTAVGLSQCRMIDDTVAGVDLKSSGSVGRRNDCMDECEDKYRDAKKAEDRRHKDAMKACGRDTECKDKENDLHKANSRKIKADKATCKDGCYNEGGGGGGR